MNVPLKALSWATRFFWIIAIVVAITCAYSATLIHFNFGEPAISYAQEKISITLPFDLRNHGYYNIADFNITTIILSNSSNRISRETTYYASITPKENVTIYHNITMNLEQMAEREDILFNDSNFTLIGAAKLSYANIIPLGISTNTTIPWGAPLYNFTIGNPTFTPHNLSHLRVNIPISFQNHSPYFSVTGTMGIEMFNSRSTTQGSGLVSVNVEPLENYDGYIDVYVNSRLTALEDVHYRVWIETSFFSYEFGDLSGK